MVQMFATTIMKGAYLPVHGAINGFGEWSLFLATVVVVIVVIVSLLIGSLLSLFQRRNVNTSNDIKDQPAPTPNDPSKPDVWKLVMADMEERR